MDRDITVRFYELTVGGGARTNPAGVLRRISGLANKRDRQCDVGNGICLRLEGVSEGDGLLFGDITRVQTDNLPGHVTDQDNDPLPVDEIGHYAAFCYEPDTAVMALQFDQKIGVGRVCNYLSQFAGDDQISHLPVLREGRLDRFQRETPTELTVRIAGINNFRDVPREQTDYEDELDGFADHFGGANLKVTVSTRASRGGLNPGHVADAVRTFLRRRDAGGDVVGLTAKTAESDEAYNFIQHLLKEKTTLELEPNNPARNRETRVNYVKQCYDGHRAYLRRIAGVD